MRENKAKRKLQNGEVVTVVSGHQNSDMIDFMGSLGLDGVWLEGEHGPLSLDEIGDMSRACDLWGMTSVTRVNSHEPGLIMRNFDRGSQGVVVPHVSTREAAERVVQAAKYAPIGQRGMYGGRQSYGATDYFKNANDETLVVILIEEQHALENLAEILTVDHIDVFFVAPSDLAQTMGHIGNPSHPDVQAAIDKAIAQIVAAGRLPGTLVNDGNVETYIAAGARFFLTPWTHWVAQGVKAYQERVKVAAAQR
jgi:4-hydroxy-2-oxoheptanedioate aldolase